MCFRCLILLLNKRSPFLIVWSHLTPLPLIMKLQFCLISVLLTSLLLEKQQNWNLATPPFYYSLNFQPPIVNFQKRCCSLVQCLLRNVLYSLVVIRILLILDGDIESNPGPVLPYQKIVTKLKTTQNHLKFFHQNCQSIIGQRLLLKNLLSDLGENCISGFSESWLKSDNDGLFWSLHKDWLTVFRSDRQTNMQTNNKGAESYFLFLPNFGCD